MLDFDKYLMRHGEYWVQTIIEQIERNDGIRALAGMSLEQRWDAVMQPATEQRLAA
jgi:hypothetical protein